MKENKVYIFGIISLVYFSIALLVSILLTISVLLNSEKGMFNIFSLIFSSLLFGISWPLLILLFFAIKEDERLL